MAHSDKATLTILDKEKALVPGPAQALLKIPGIYLPWPFSTAALAPVSTAGVLLLLADKPFDDLLVPWRCIRCFFIGAEAPDIGAAVESPAVELSLDVCAKALPVARSPAVRAIKSVFLVIIKTPVLCKRDVQVLRFSGIAVTIGVTTNHRPYGLSPDDACMLEPGTQ
jgi:hypothetical protein